MAVLSSGYNDALLPAVAVGACVVYWCLSWLFWCYPNLLHGKPRIGRVFISRAKRAGGRCSADDGSGKEEGAPDGPTGAPPELETDDYRFRVQHLAHRGVIGEAGLIENTLPAFVHAVNTHTDMIELDVWLTKDEQVVVFHDDDLKRLTGKSGRVPDLAYADLPPLIFPHEGDANVREEKIPLLSEVFDAIPSTTVVLVEFKHGHPVLIEKVHELIMSRRRKAFTLWYSLIHSVNVNLRARDPSIPQVTSMLSIVRLVALYCSGLLPFLPHTLAFHEDIFLAFYSKYDYDYLSSHTRWPHWLRVLAPYAMPGRPPWVMCPPGLVEHLRKRGIPTWLVNVNDADSLSAAAAMGSTAVFTDYPAWLAKQRGADGRLPLPRLDV